MFYRLEEEDRKIKRSKKERNALSNKGQRNVIASEFKIMKDKIQEQGNAATST